MKFFLKNFYCTYKNLKPPWNIAFFGSDLFSLASLEQINHLYKKNKLVKNLEVVTSKKSKMINPIYDYATQQNLKIHNWPIDFRNSNYDLGIVVSFGYLIPEQLIHSFRLGMINVHASLLPRWRGAAPIIYSIAFGDKETGITIMNIKPKKFDIGEIIKQVKMPIDENAMMPYVHDELSKLGAKVLIDTLYELPDCLTRAIPQGSEGVTYAPRVTQEFAKIDWNEMTSIEIYNRYRSLISAFPLFTKFNNMIVKVYEINLVNNNEHTSMNNLIVGQVIFFKQQNLLKVYCIDNRFISIKKLTIVGKKQMTPAEFYNGYLSKVALSQRKFQNY